MLIATEAMALWSGSPPLKNTFGEHQYLAACREGRKDVVKHYLEIEGFNPDQTFTSGRSGEKITCLFLASALGFDQIVDALVHTAKVDVNKGYFSETPLYAAASRGHHRVVEILVKTERVKLYSKNLFDRHPLFAAADNGHPRVAEILLNAGKYEVNKKLRELTPLGAACANGHHEVVDVFISHNTVDLNRGIDEFSTVCLAVDMGHYEVIKSLARAETVDFNKQCGRFRPLQIAINKGDIKTVQALLEAGADPSLPFFLDFWDRVSSTPLKYAKMKRPRKLFGHCRAPDQQRIYSEIIRLLKSRIKENSRLERNMQRLKIQNNFRSGSKKKRNAETVLHKEPERTPLLHSVKHTRYGKT